MVMVREAKEKEPGVGHMLRWDRDVKLTMNLGVLGEFIDSLRNFYFPKKNFAVYS